MALRRRDRRGSGSGRRHRRRGRRTERHLASQGVGIGYVACLMPRVRVPPLRVLLALAGGRVLARLCASTLDVRPRDLQHSLDVGGLGSGTWVRVCDNYLRCYLGESVSRELMNWLKVSFNSKNRIRDSTSRSGHSTTLDDTLPGDYNGTLIK